MLRGRLTCPSSCFFSFFFCWPLIQLAIFQMDHYGTSLSALTHSSEDPTTAWCPLAVNRHSSFYMLPCSGMIRSHLAVSFSADDRDVFYQSIGLTGILLVVSVTELFFFRPFSLLPFPGEASHTYFFRRKVSASRILQVPDALFLEFFQKLFAACASQ